MNLGGPDTIAAIRPFLVNLFSDNQIIKLPIQPVLSRIIAWTRAKKVAQRYKMIGGGSPIIKLTEEQSAKTAERLRSSGYDCRGYVGMNYWHPYIKEAVVKAAADGYEQILGFSLFPHFSKATTGACLRDLENAVAYIEKALTVDTIDAWYDDPQYVKALADTVNIGLKRFPSSERKDVKVLFSAHSLPKSFIDQGDPYQKHLEATVKSVLELTGYLDWALTYQSRSGPVEWLEPQTDEEIVALARLGVKNLLVVPLSFVSDHIETLYELDIMYRDLALGHGIEKFERAPALNSVPAFIESLAGLVEKKIGPPTQSPAGE